MNTHLPSREAPLGDRTRGKVSLRTTVSIPVGRVTLMGDLEIPRGAGGLVLFAHGSGSSRHSLRNQAVARVLRASGTGTLLFDLLTPDEEEVAQLAAGWFQKHLRRFQ
jgi:putative phosphoribosyl transferase